MNGPDSYPGVSEQQAERNELMRIAAVSALKHSDNGRRLHPDARAWAKHWAAIKPLGRPLSAGEPSENVTGDEACNSSVSAT